MQRNISLAALGLAGLVLASPALAQHTVRAQHSAPPRRQQQRHRIISINMDIDFKPHTRTDMGKLAGFDPVVTQVHRGDRIQFVNVDDIRHTATGYAFGGGKIPANYKFQGDPSVSHGNVIDQSEWSTGNVNAHSRSKIFQTGPTGTFYFADAYHPTEMRGAIVVKP
jgi:plastocyanin